MAAGAIVVVAGLITGRVIPAWREWVAVERRENARALSALSTATTAVGKLSVTRDSLAARNARYLALAPVIVPGATRGAAAASLSALVSGAAASAGLRIGALQVRLDTSRSGTRSVFYRVAVRGDAVGDVRGVTLFLASIERGPAILAVRQFSISQPEPNASPGQPEALRLEFVIEGLGLRRAASDSARSDPTKATEPVSRHTPMRGSK